MKSSIDSAVSDICDVYRDKRYGAVSNIPKNHESLCMLCSAKFLQYNDYVKHITTAHPDVDEPNKVFKDPWRCVHCDSWFDGSRRLLAHIRETHPTPPSATPVSLQQDNANKRLSDVEPLKSNKNCCTICKMELSASEEAQGPSCSRYNTRTSVTFCRRCRSKLRMSPEAFSNINSSLMIVRDVTSQQKSVAAPGQHILPPRRILVIRRKPNNIETNVLSSR